MCQTISTSVALDARQQRAGSVPKLVFQVVGMPRPGAQRPMARSVGFDAGFEARRMGTSDVIRGKSGVRYGGRPEAILFRPFLGFGSAAVRRAAIAPVFVAPLARLAQVRFAYPATRAVEALVATARAECPVRALDRRR